MVRGSEKEKPIRWNLNTYGIVVHGVVTLAVLCIFSIYSLSKLSKWRITRFTEYPIKPRLPPVLEYASDLTPSVERHSKPVLKEEPSPSTEQLPSASTEQLPPSKEEPLSPSDSVYLWANPDAELMQRFYDHQFPESCEGKKFIMYRLDKMLTRNVGSITTQVAHWMGDALISDRILIWGPQILDMADCPEKNWECYFEPISSCTYKDLPPNYTSMEINDDIQNNTLYESIDVSIAWRKWWRVLDPHIRQYLKYDAIKFHAYCYAFLLRLNKRIKSKVEDRMRALLKEYPDMEPAKTLSIPMRRGDKCKGHHIGHSAPGEDDCLALTQWIDAINKYRCKHHDCDEKKLSSFIVTCGEEAVVRNMTRLGKENNWNVIFNKFDVMQGTGSANDLQALKSSLTTEDVIVSIFTSLQLQLHGKFFVKKKHRRYSSWIMLIEYMMVKIPEATPGDEKVKIVNLWEYTKV